MAAIPYRTALIVGVGPGISASVARALAAAGLKVGLAARNIDKLSTLAAEIGAERFAVDATDPAAVAHLFEAADARIGGRMSFSIIRAPGRPARSPRSIQKRCARRSRFRPLAPSSSCSRRRGA